MVDISKGRKSKNVIDRRTTTIEGSKLKREREALLAKKAQLKKLQSATKQLTALQKKRKKAITAQIAKLKKKT